MHCTLIIPVGESAVLLPQRGQMKGWGEEVAREDPHSQAALVASVPPAPSAHPYAAHTEKSASPAP